MKKSDFIWLTVVIVSAPHLTNLVAFFIAICAICAAIGLELSGK
ncbi:hypothetical protein [Burkholderia gladioli]|nr:hypothetical protein [Burkholderia gladioli]